MVGGAAGRHLERMNSTSPKTSTPRRYLRSRQDKKIAGVCGGLARYFELDPLLVRIAMVALVFTGVGILTYAALWILAPYEEDEAGADVPTATTTPSASSPIAA
jgi:phage shock protein PspC (stress-responsive transcriptional regulator)